MGKCYQLVYNKNETLQMDLGKADISVLFFPKPEPHTRIHISMSQLVASGWIRLQWPELSHGPRECVYFCYSIMFLYSFSSCRCLQDTSSILLNTRSQQCPLMTLNRETWSEIMQCWFSGHTRLPPPISSIREEINFAAVQLPSKLSQIHRLPDFNEC